MNFRGAEGLFPVVRGAVPAVSQLDGPRRHPLLELGCEAVERLLWYA